MKAPPRKRVLIEASKLADRNMDGIKRYVVELLTAFSRMDREFLPDLDVMIMDEVFPLDEIISHLAAPGNQSATHPPSWMEITGRKVSRLLAPVAHHLWARDIWSPRPRAINPEPYDLVHHTLPNNCHMIRQDGTPWLVTVHDLCHLACPEFQTAANNLTLEKGLESSVAAGARFLAVSDATREQLVDAYRLNPNRVVTAHNGCNATNFHRVTDESELKRVCSKYGIPHSPFLLTVSTIEPRKNLARTIKAFNKLLDEPGVPEINLVLAGPRGWKSNEIMSAAESSSLIHTTGNVSNDDLAALYSSARAFVYASHYEGFGLPLLEAMHCGTPVIYGNNSSMPEIVRDAGLPADSRNTRDLTKQMRRLVCQDDLVNLLGLRALERAQKFTWDQTAEHTLAAYSGN